MRWWLAGLAVALLGALAAGWLLWPHDRPARPDPSTAALFGRQVGLELPAPVTEADCGAALKTFPAIARDPAARTAFVEACVHARQ